jgi:hypothetical protein
MKTSQDVVLPGLYVTECCGQEQMFDENQVFHRCPNCHSLCEWELVEAPVAAAPGVRRIDRLAWNA